MQRDDVITMLEQLYNPATSSAEVEGLRDVLQKQVRSVDGSTLHNVHPEWLLKVLELETPRVIAILLRYIPSKQARYILDRLPTRIKDRMPHFVDAFSVPTQIVQMLRRQFEAHFTTATPVATGTDPFGELASLGFDDLPRLFSDLGVHEIALAFLDADERSVQILMKRLPETDARRLQERIQHLAEVTPQLTRDAKYTILDVNTDTLPPEQFLFEIGVRAFSKACGHLEQDLIQALSLKLEPRIGELLLKQATRKAGGREELGKMRQKMVLDRLGTLSRAGVLAS